MYGSVTYEELFGIFQREINARLTVCREKSVNDPLYQNAFNSAQSLVQSFLVVGEWAINKHIFDNKLTGEHFDNARKRFLEDYNELTSLLNLKYGHQSHSKYQALHDLICRILRGTHTDHLSADELRYYVYRAGIALHNIPLKIETGAILDLPTFLDINMLDPSAIDGKTIKWGSWVKELALVFDQDLPSLENAKHYSQKNN